jgi:hypothetical protein
MTVLDWIDDNDPQHLESFTRLRAQLVPDPYNTDALVEDWKLPTVDIELRGAWSSTGSSVGADPVREHTSTSKQLVIFDPDADVRNGDRIRDAGGSIFTVNGRPDRDQNPFTGWRPTLVINVEEGTG